MSRPIPLRANLEWLKKRCKQRLSSLRARDPNAKLSEAQLAIAREFGFSSWRKLKAHVELVRDEQDKAGRAPRRLGWNESRRSAIIRY